jgi:hypothetical protein
MKNGTQAKSVLNGTGWIVGSAGTFLLMSAGLEFFVRQTVEQTSFPTILELLYLAFWSYVVGVGLLIVAPVWLFISWLLPRMNRHAMNKRAHVEPESRRFEDSALQSPGSFEDETTVAFSERSSESRAGEAESNSLTRVA